MQHLDLTTLLAVHAHPDDETLSNGGLLAATAAAGLATTVVTLTRGEQGEVIGELRNELQGNGPALAAHREGELTRALRALGVQSHVFLDSIPGQRPGRIEDSGMAWLDQDSGDGRSGTAMLGANVPPLALVGVSLQDSATRLATIIIAAQPHTVVTYEPGGGYGHPDHIRTHEVTMAAIEIAAAGIDGKTHRVQQTLWTVIPRHIAGSARIALRTIGNELGRVSGLGQYLDAEDPYGSVSAPDLRADAMLDVRPVLGSVSAALQAHATQVKWTQTLAEPILVADHEDEPIYLMGSYALSNNIVVPLLSHEFYAAGQPSRPVTV